MYISENLYPHRFWVFSFSVHVGIIVILYHSSSISSNQITVNEVHNVAYSTRVRKRTFNSNALLRDSAQILLVQKGGNYDISQL